MSLIKTLSHGNILNFFNARDGAGSILESEGGALWTATSALVTTTDNALGVSQESAPKALTSGSLETPAATSDWALMLVANFDSSIIKSFSLGVTSDNSRITLIAGGDLEIDGVDGTLIISASELNAETVTKSLVTFDIDGNVNLHYSDQGIDLSNTPNSSGLVSVCGALGTLGNTLALQAFGGNGLLYLYGLQMVEFPNGLPNDVAAKADECMEAWYAGNKRHYELLEEND